MSRKSRICFERLREEEFQAQQDQRQAVRDHMDAHGGQKPGAKDRMALVEAKKWPNGSTLRCRFLEGPKFVRDKVVAVARTWEKHANIRLKFVDHGPAEIRIAFDKNGGSWSYVGTDALDEDLVGADEPTMNYGWLDENTEDEEYQRVVLHEFGHALGCVHEHQSPTFDRKWDLDVVMEQFQGPPNNWSPEKIRFNVLEKLAPEGILASEFDPESIMLYSFDGNLFADGEGPTNSNDRLSAKDIEHISKMYPKSE